MKTNFLRKSALAALTLTTASFYFAQEQENSKDIEEVVLVATGVADIAKDRKTPVAVSTIKEGAIIEKLGNQEFPEILNTTPSVYATKAGGGFGDSKINIRGFSQENIAVMVNGMPINDMETGRVFWSNWSGLSDVTSAMQVQRGLGASKLAIASVGGTINILTRAADKRRGGTLSVGIGNDGYHKALFAYNTGKNAKGWSSSFLFSRTAGAMYADGTNFEGYNYYFALGYQPNRKHDLQFTFTGAPQWHHQRSTSISISDYLKYGNGVDRPNRRYNSDWGYLRGTDGVDREYSLRKNFYHKPIMSLNWDWNMTQKSKLSTVLYASFGRGGGTGDLGGFFAKTYDNYGKPRSNGASRNRTQDGLIDFTKIISTNNGMIAGASVPYTDPKTGRVTNLREGIVRRTSVNSHNWYGILSNFQHKINDNWNFSIGVDGRYYKGYHYQYISDFFGATGYKDENYEYDRNRVVSNSHSSEYSWNPFVGTHRKEDRIGYDNDGEVIWYGTFGQLEYSDDKFSAFVQGAISNQGFKRVDYYKIVSAKTGEALPKETSFKTLTGFNVKGGFNYNINEQHNIFANAGYYEKQPFFNAVYRSNENLVAEGLTNEKILGLELGYGFRSSIFDANVNLYRTTWKDRYERRSGITVGDDRLFAELNGLEEIHQGVEVDFNAKLDSQVSLTGAFSYGDWRYTGSATADLFYEADSTPYTPSGATTNTSQLYLNGVRVGDAAQLTAALGLNLTPITGLNFNATWRYVDNLYSRVDPYSFADKRNAEKGALRLPSYNLLDLGISYKLNIGNGQSFTLRGNVYNVLDTIYIAESYTSHHLTDAEIAGRQDYKGLSKRNQVYFGYGRTWSVSLTYNF